MSALDLSPVAHELEKHISRALATHILDQKMFIITSEPKCQNAKMPKIKSYIGTRNTPSGFRVAWEPGQLRASFLYLAFRAFSLRHV